ncbi:MAG: HAD-IIIA family hydrolase [Thermoplasmatales archaeon]|nr:HAD-IIIA family hydrolase [Thermoplasmatales archaeon]
MISIKQAVILAGGLGTRLKPITDKIPKPMIEFHNKPFLEYIIEMLKENGVEEVVLLLGYLPDPIVKYFGDGEKFGIKIKYSIGTVEDKTGTRIRNAKELLDEHFMLMYCDNYLPFNLKQYVDFHNKQKTQATVMVYTNKDGFTKNNILVDENGFVVKYDKTRKDTNLSGVEIGFFILDKEKIFGMMPDDNFSFEKVIIPPLVKEHNLSGFLTDHRYYSIGNLERLKITERFFKPKKVVFLDRDGVINKKAPKADYVKKWDEFKFIPGAIEGMKYLSENDYQIFIITNQAGIARGMMTEEDLADIHKKLKEELSKHNVKINGIYYCPHGWDEGCDCRKPKPGMFFQAAREHGIDLSKTIFIGDDERDKIAGDAAGLTTILVNPNESLLEVVKTIPELDKKPENVSYEKMMDELIYRYSKSDKDRFFIAIAGCSRSGKTMLAQKIKDDLSKKGIDSSMISLDNWLLDLNVRTGDETIRERFQYEKISDALSQIKSGENIYPPVYDAKTRMIVSEKSSKPLFVEENSIGIIDGIVSLDVEKAREISDFKIFVDIDDNTRKERLIDFYVNYKKYSLEDAKKIIEPRETDEVKIIEKTKNYADVIYIPENNDEEMEA